MHSQAQEPLYLDKTFRLTAKKTAITCAENVELSREELKCYDCYGTSNALEHQLSGEFYINKALIAEEHYQPYIVKGKRGWYLRGSYKEGKPFNGFFRVSDDLMNEWLFCDFYQNGVRTEQFANNIFKALIEGCDDDETSWYALNQKTTYQNGIPENGIRLNSFLFDEVTILILENISNGTTDDYIVGLFAMHYAEFIFIKEVAKNCFELKCFAADNPIVNISYTDTERAYRFTWNDDSCKTVELAFYQQKLTDFDIFELKEQEVALYYEKDGEIHVDRQKNPFVHWDEWKQADISKALELLVDFWGHYPPKLNPQYIFDAITRRFDKYGKMLSSITRIDGEYFGFKYEPGEKEKTYTVTLLREQNEAVLGKGKTTDEISTMLTSLMQQE